MDQIDGRTAFVTGGASGIGLAIAEALVAAGARVVLADWNVEALEREAARLGGATVAQHLDVTDRAGWEVAKRASADAFGPVDLLVNNAGVAPGPYELADMPPDHFDRIIHINLIGVFNGVRTFGPDMRARGAGHIVNVASMVGLAGVSRMGAYTAAKFGVVGLSEALRDEMAPHGVGVSVLCPGAVHTNITAHEEVRDPRSVAAFRIPARVVADHLLEAIRAGDFYVMTHANGANVAARAARLQEAFDKAPARQP